MPPLVPRNTWPFAKAWGAALKTPATSEVEVPNEVTGTVQGPVPEVTEQNPIQPANVEVPLGVAVIVTSPEVAAIGALQVPLVAVPLNVQLIPAGLLVIVPVPLPSAETVTVGLPNVAVTAWGPFIVTTQLALPVQPAPLQEVKTVLAVGVVDRVTTSPAAKSAEQVPGQLIPAGVLETCGIDPPAGETVTVKVLPGAPPTVPETAMLNDG
jgi:hypothetical protein